MLSTISVVNLQARCYLRPSTGPGKFFQAGATPVASRSARSPWEPARQLSASNISGCGLQGIHNIPVTEDFREHPKLDLGDLNIISSRHVRDVVLTEEA